MIECSQLKELQSVNDIAFLIVRLALFFYILRGLQETYALLYTQRMIE